MEQNKVVGKASQRGLPCLGLVAVFFLAVLLRYPIATIPLERDEGGYAYTAQRWLMGEIPYKGPADHKPPGVFVAYALIIRLIGTSPAALHWGTQIYTLATLGLLFVLGRKLFSAQVGIVAAALTAFMTADHTVLGNAANTEVFMLLPIVAAMLTVLVAVERESMGWGLLSGMLSAIAVLFKQVALPNFVFCLLFTAWVSRRRWLLAASMLLGATAVAILVFSYFLGVGAWKEFYEWAIAYGFSYAGLVPLSRYPANFWITFSHILRSFWPIFLLSLVGLVRSIGRSVGDDPQGSFHNRKTAIAVGWLLFSFLGAAMGGYFREHYFIQIVPMIALLAGSGVTGIAFPPRAKLRGVLPYLAAGVVIFYGIAGAPWYYLGGSPEEKCGRLYGRNPFAESMAVSRFIADRSDPQDAVFVFGSEPQILYYAQRRSASRYIFVYPLMVPLRETRDRQREVLEELRKNNPEFIVTVFVPTSFLASAGTPSDLFNGLQQLLARSYRVVGVVLYRRGNRSQLVTGQAATQLWENAPMWYNTPIWGSLAIWQRLPPPVRPSQ